MPVFEASYKPRQADGFEEGHGSAGNGARENEQ